MSMERSIVNATSVEAETNWIGGAWSGYRFG